ncbi:hypothetical protein KCP69_16895 [Salmonella enterica subsp. enterica]|nr:hypothetical protein KCP69_16895 [Salmonella enterica subsp. enterica]
MRWLTQWGLSPFSRATTSYQTATARNKTNLTANLFVAIICGVPYSSAMASCSCLVFLLIRSRIGGRYPVVTIAMSMISGKLGRCSKQSKSQRRPRDITAVPLALPLWRGQGD